MSTRTYPTGGRYFSNSINIEKSHPVFLQIFDASSVSPQNHTGNWRPAGPSDFAANISLSGVTLSIGSVAVTGTTQTSIVNPILPISGVVTVLGGSSSSNGSVQITGNSLVGITGTTNVNIVNTSPLNVSGNLNLTGSLIITSVSVTGVTNVTGNIFSNYPGSTSVSNSTISGANGTALSENLNRKQWFIQNNSTGFLFVKLGTGASSTSFNMVLKGSASQQSYDGAIFIDDGARWKGNVSVSGGAPNYMIWETV